MKQSTKQPTKNTNKHLKIGLVIDDSLDKLDGVQQYVITLGTWLSAQGHDIHYISSTTERTDLQNVHVLGKNIQSKFNGNRLGTPLPASPATIKKLLQAEQFDILHIQMPYSPFLAGQVIQHAPKDTAIVGTFHIYPESNIVSYATKALGLLVARQLLRFDRIVTVSEAAQEFAQQSFGVKTGIIPNLVDVKRFTAKPKPSDQSEPKRIVFLGRLVERKGAQYLLEAINFLHEHSLVTAPFIVHIGGKGPLRESLEQYVAEHGLVDYVQFDGFIEESAKVDYIAQADIAVFPSTGGESFGISVVEGLAAASGVVIAGDNPGYRTVMKGREQQLVNPRDTEVFAHKLADCIANDSERADARSWQRSRAHLFDTDSVGPQIVDMYIDALRQRRT